MEPLEIDYDVPVGTFRHAYRAFLWRKVGGFGIGAALGLVLAAAVAPSEPWLSGFLAGLAVAYLLSLVRLSRRVAIYSRGREASRVHLRIDDEGVSFRSERGDFKIHRHRLRAVRRIGLVVELDLGRDESPVWIPEQAVSGVPFARLQELAGDASAPRV